MKSNSNESPKIILSRGRGGGLSALIVENDGTILTSTGNTFNFIGNINASLNGTLIDITVNQDVDGGFANSIYMANQICDGGNALG